MSCITITHRTMKVSGAAAAPAAPGTPRSRPLSPAEHPGSCPAARPCRRPGARPPNQCLDDSICARGEKCCDTGCSWQCRPLPAGSVRPPAHPPTALPPRDCVLSACPAPAESSVRPARWCVEQCDRDTQCPHGQRCVSTGCDRICINVPRGEGCTRTGCPVAPAWGLSPITASSGPHPCEGGTKVCRGMHPGVCTGGHTWAAHRVRTGCGWGHTWAVQGPCTGVP
uniref:WAP domain-containing protein n=1 Tax=Nothoprocta perdicaria TaxID=30464 RepID=A0A8C6Z9X4_NOTPE